MNILVIGLALLFAHLGGFLWRPTQQRLFNAYMDPLAKLFSQTRWLDGGFGVLMLLVLPVALVATGQYFLQADKLQLWAFVYALFFMTMAFGPRSLDGDVQDYLNGENEEARARAAEELAFTYRHPMSGGGRDAVIRGVFYQGLVRWFGVIFWFLLLGAAGAILFRTVHLLLCEQRGKGLLTPRQVVVCKRLVAILDLLPAALTTFALAIVGDFDTVIRTWRHHFVTNRHSALSWDYEYLPEVGIRTVMRGDEMEDAFSHDYDGGQAKVSLAMSLVYRTLICWLTVIALMIIANLVR